MYMEVMGFTSQINTSAEPSQTNSDELAVLGLYLTEDNPFFAETLISRKQLEAHIGASVKLRDRFTINLTPVRNY